MQLKTDPQIILYTIIWNYEDRYLQVFQLCSGLCVSAMSSAKEEA